MVWRMFDLDKFYPYDFMSNIQEFVPHGNIVPFSLGQINLKVI
jgi:hypothetical protein